MAGPEECGRDRLRRARRRRASRDQPAATTIASVVGDNAPVIRIGVDVGGTNTDAVVMHGDRVDAWAKATTTPEVTGGIVQAVREALGGSHVAPAEVRAVMVGTTHFTNAVVERHRLAPTALVRIGLPATLSVPPMSDWPADLRNTLGGHTYLAHGGHEFDGRSLAPLDASELRGIGRQIAATGVRDIAVCAVFSPLVADAELRAAEILAEEVPGAEVSLSHEIGQLGLLERENATALNACLRPLAARTIDAITGALDALDLRARLYLTQNDGTLMSAEVARRYPVLTFASGPTNSMRGAAFLSGLHDGLVADIGGTTTDLGTLVRGFPREAGVAVRVGGVRTNFRMPDVLSLGIGGGSIVRDGDPPTIGPTSVGWELKGRALIFGGDVLTATDLAVAAGRAEIGDRALVRHLDRGFVSRALETIGERLADALDRMRTSPDPVPLVLVGGGSVLVGDALPGVSEVVRPPHHAVANAVGAAIAEVSGEVDRVFSLAADSRERVIERATAEAVERAARAGADPLLIRVINVEGVPLAYLPSSATRVRVKAVGPLRAA